jgi:hypothetical protein
MEAATGVPSGPERLPRICQAAAPRWLLSANAVDQGQSKPNGTKLTQ